MITMIYAPPGFGKTALATHFGLERMRGPLARADIKACDKILEPLNNNGFKLSLRPNTKHLTFADYPIIGNRKATRTSWEIDGYYLGLPNATHPTMFLPPHALIILDESQKYYDSRKSNYLSDFVSRFFELHRHYDLEIIITVQRPGLIDLNIRELSQRVIEVLGMDHKYEHGLLRRTIWHCREYDNVALALRNIDSGKTLKVGKQTKYVHEGNIFKHYDSKNWFPAFLKDKGERKYFDMRPAKRCAKTLAAIKEFNELHNCEVPETYLKKGVRG